MDKISKALTGVAGEYFVAAELSRRGYIASLTLRNTKGIDILAANEHGTKTVGIQVKTNQASNSSWVLNRKNEDYDSQNLIYILVNLNENKQMPTYHIVPSKIVSNKIKHDHEKWLDTPGKKGKKHLDNNIRKFTDREDKYLDNWDLINEMLSI